MRCASSCSAPCSPKHGEAQGDPRRGEPGRVLATHRFLTVHSESLGGNARSSGEWLEQVEWRDLIAGAVELLRIARSAVIYLARLIDIGEGIASQARQDQAKAAGKPILIPPLPLPRAITEDADFDF